MTVKSPGSARTVAAVRAAKQKSVRPGSADFYRGDDYRIHDSVGYLLKQVRWALERVVDAEMAEHDLTGVQWGPLLMLHYKMGTTAAELARIACVDTGAMTRMLDRLETKGLVRRTPCAKDRRVVQLELTPDGARLYRDIPFGFARVNNRLLTGFTRQEFEMLKDFLRRMLSNVEERER
ncbi:MAG TPA: MarR family transcriptional regulator [Casimicrobiaceae bacterium]